MSRDIAIDRLVLDIPGLEPARAVLLAERIALGLAGGLGGARDIGGALSVRLDAIPGESDARLAERAVSALLDGIG